MTEWRKVLRSERYRSLPKDSPLRVYVRIMAAAEAGRGVVVSPEETWKCSLDDAIETAALAFLEEEDGPGGGTGPESTTPPTTQP